MIYKIIILLFILQSISAQNGQITVTTKLGRIIGQTQTVENKELSVFLGIPYAQPPLNDLRFQKPLPIKPWKTPLRALNYPNSCYQLSVLSTFLNPTISEDCLYLSIYGPKVNSRINSRLLPVIVWIHGGGFVSGTSIYNGTIPTILTARGNVIFVGVNYRVNALGFLYTGTDDAPGNVGIYDQILAMEWVKEHISAFGGDPNRVTLYGLSAGSVAVSLHLLSPLSRNLFKNAVMMSDTVLNTVFVHNRTTVLQSWVRGAKTVGCGNGENFTPQTIECLKTLDVQKLVRIPFSKDDRDAFRGVIPMIWYGNELLPQKPSKMIETGNFKRRVSLLAGNTDDEGSHSLPFFDPNLFNSTRDISLEEANEEVRQIVKNLKTNIPVNPNDVSRVYFNGIGQGESDRLRRAMGGIVGDFQISCLILKFAKSFFNRQNNVYEYYISHKPKDLSLSFFYCPPYAGTCHTVDLISWFGNPFQYPNGFDDDDRRVSEIAMNVLTQFVNNGVPPPQNGREWPKYSGNGRKINAPYYTISTNPAFGSNLKHTECDILWKQYIDNM